MQRSVCGCSLTVVLCLVATHCEAVDYFWTNANGGAFDEPSNWTPFSPPVTQGPGGASDTVNFDLGMATSSRYVVTDAGRENSQLIVHNDSVEMTIFVNQEFSSVGGANPSLVVGAASGDTGDLILWGGGASVLQTDVTRIANAAGSTGTLTVEGLDWNGGNLRVGRAGTGALRVADDANIVAANVSLGHLIGSDGSLSFIGDGSLTTEDLLIGREGDGTLSISFNGVLTSTRTSIGSEPTGEGNAHVSGQFTAWTIQDNLTVGGVGDGSILMTSGSISNTNAVVGDLPGSNGFVDISGGQWTTAEQLSIGGQTVGGVNGGSGIFRISGGDVEVQQQVVIYAGGLFDLLEGSLDAAIITVEPNGQFDWTGGNLLVDTFQGNLSNSGGTLAARTGSNSMLVTGEYSQSSTGVLRIGIDGPAASHEYDSLTVGNTAFLDGILRVELAENFQPGPGDVYVVLDALNLGAGAFSNVANGDRLFLDQSAGSFLVHYGIGSPFDPSQVVLSDFQPPATGDFDNDGDVDGRDFLIWQRGMSPNPFSETDLTVWQDNYNAAPLAAAVTAVPEPCATALLFCGCAGGLWRRWFN